MSRSSVLLATQSLQKFATARDAWGGASLSRNWSVLRFGSSCESLGDGAGLYVCCFRQVRNGTRRTQYASRRSGREPKPIDGAPEQGVGFGLVLRIGRAGRPGFRRSSARRVDVEARGRGRRAPARLRSWVPSWVARGLARPARARSREDRCDREAGPTPAADSVRSSRRRSDSPEHRSGTSRTDTGSLRRSAGNEPERHKRIPRVRDEPNALPAPPAAIRGNVD